ncbi:transcription-repair coupling factor [Pacificimonas flava]|uniref:Transcription-repair-coupling factor n=2 Tax=Pacificimonas TaxID=1960290 RepID=A0A219B768_9SPHN|nr:MULTISPECIES: transcription-repair coupling factor [Pacificimonas]MBZ6378707.1 transcription-repair coupling factor [Pacificimonas aurantium]OWV34024.1 transcription-repair coupling factor [Pacificimonas flava]
MTTFDRIAGADAPLVIGGAPQGYHPLLLSELARRAGEDDGRAVYIAPEDLSAATVAEAAGFFAPEIEIVQIPAWDSLPYDRASPSLKVAADRAAGLARLSEHRRGPQLVVTTINAVLQRTLKAARLGSLTAYLAAGESIDPEDLIARLVSNGFVRTDTVLESGEFAVRGGILDLFPGGRDEALRLDFFGDEIDSMRRFDPATQRTTGDAEPFTLRPVSEVLLTEDAVSRFRRAYVDLFGSEGTSDPLYQAVSEGRRLAGMENWLPLFEEEMGTLFDLLDERDIVVAAEGVPPAAAQRFEAIEDYHDNRVRALKGEAGTFRPLPTDALYLTESEWAARRDQAPVHMASAFSEPEDAGRAVEMGVKASRDFAPERAAQDNLYTAFAAHAEALRKDGISLLLAAYTEGARARLASQLSDNGFDSWKEISSWAEADALSNQVGLAVLPIEHGFLTEKLSIVSEQDLLGDRLVRRARKKRKTQAFMDQLSMMVPGDLVVHQDHGIGRYEGLTAIEVGSQPHDCVQLTYAGDDKLYVPVENMDVLSRYGAGSETVVLDRMGGANWQARKAKAKERIREIANELIRTAALRAQREGKVFDADAGQLGAFVDRFPYEETDDQLKAVDDTLEDLASGKPVDRLIVGDVGFGKTEVALRAAFVAAMEGQQVAVVCPTTLLTRQHYRQFRDRFEGFPVEVGQISRLVSQKEQKRVKEGLASGEIDIVVGTHALLAKAIDFKRLGLVIVDEEQRFGVAHKERLKQMKTDVHMLTLTATPIPRTLQMAMSGMRDMSLIATPPVDRLAVRTYVMPWDPVVMREALLREHFRGGQSFLVTPRVADIPELEEFFREWVPEVKYVIAHGQMSAGQVEERMSAFYDHEYDVLVSTTIVESGIDIPSANTMIIHRADMFGLAQLYQLRGRVGRSKTRAYAYMTTPDDKALAPTAQKRLQVLSSLDSLGAGFQLAAQDLDIRGAGNLLGDEQSGHIKEVGFELYQSMLEEAMLTAKAHDAGLDAPREAFSPQINVDAAILIPEDYVSDLNLRMSLYKRLGDIEDAEDVDAMAAELVDRFGQLPDEVKNLLQVIETKIHCKTANISKIEAGAKGALITFHNDEFARPEKLIGFAQKNAGVVKLRPDHKMFIQRDWRSPQQRLTGTLKVSKSMARLAG